MFAGPIACIGEMMIELSDLDALDGRIRLGFAGDTCNTAIYLARLLGAAGTRVGYVTALGRDRFSDRMIATLDEEGIATNLIARLPDRLPGLYAIEIDGTGERSFRYWREVSAARAMFGPGGVDLAALRGYGTIYLSGITLAILPEADRARLLALLKRHRETGGAVVFDPNYRPRLWSSPREAQRWTTEALAASSVALPSIDDEMALFGDADEDAVLTRLASSGPREIVLKRGAAGPLVRADGATEQPPCAAALKVVDTTAAGDSFNAGYMAARIAGAHPPRAAQSGHALAAQVIGHPGAIMARDVPLAR